jgi:hypothetical protein
MNVESSANSICLAYLRISTQVGCRGGEQFMWVAGRVPCTRYVQVATGQELRARKVMCLGETSRDSNLKRVEKDDEEGTCFTCPRR